MPLTSRARARSAAKFRWVSATMISAPISRSRLTARAAVSLTGAKEISGPGEESTSVSGADLLAALENGVSEVENGAGRFPQVSGLSFLYDPKAPKGSRVAEVAVGGTALEPGRIYKVATNDYLLGGGDGYSSLKGAKALIDAAGAKLMASSVMDYIAANEPVAPKIEGRIRTK